MTRTALMRLDFAGDGKSWSLGGVALCAVGIGACVWVGIAFNAALIERGRLDGVIESLNSRRSSPSDNPARAAEQAEFAKTARQLAVPWTKLLQELEAASRDMANSVALLQVEPDAEKHLVRITAEVHSLPDALAYLRRLQQSPVLRYPMLESHERVKDDPEHAVRVKLTVEWRS